jgi:hypothetical protein
LAFKNNFYGPTEWIAGFSTTLSVLFLRNNQFDCDVYDYTNLKSQDYIATQSECGNKKQLNKLFFVFKCKMRFMNPSPKTKKHFFSFMFE